MRKNNKDKIMIGSYKEVRKTKRINGKTHRVKLNRANPVASFVSLIVIISLVMVAAFNMPRVINSVTYNRFLTGEQATKMGAMAEEQSREYKSMVVIETNSNRVLNAYKENERLPMASTTKIMTALVTLENIQDLDTKHMVPECAVGIEGSSMYLKKGEWFSVRELLYGLMLPSGNDSATALSIIVSGSEEAFVTKMNQKAQELGLKNTQFKNPHGLHQEGHYTTSRDLATITSFALQNETFSEIVKAPSYKIEKTDKNALRVFKNKQKLITDEELKTNGIQVTGVKSGFTPEAGRCLVTSATTSDGMNLVCVVLNAPKMFESTASLLMDAKNNYSMQTVLTPKEHISSISVVGSNKKEVKIYHNGFLRLPLTPLEQAELKVSYNYPELLVAPVTNEQVVGEVIVTINGETIYTSPIQTLEEAPNITIGSIVKRIIKSF